MSRQPEESARLKAPAEMSEDEIECAWEGLMRADADEGLTSEQAARLRALETEMKRREAEGRYMSDVSEPRDEAPHEPSHDVGYFDEDDRDPLDDEDPGAECGRWSNGRLMSSCAKAGSEECDFECPYSR